MAKRPLREERAAKGSRAAQKVAWEREHANEKEGKDGGVKKETGWRGKVKKGKPGSPKGSVGEEACE